MKELKDCPCGKKPKNLIITDAGQGGKWAWVGGDCCEYWEIEFRTGYNELTSDKCMLFAEDAWNMAKRASIPISKLQELMRNTDCHSELCNGILELIDKNING